MTGDNATVTSSSYGKTFSLQTCSLDDELGNAYLEGETDGLTFELDVITGVGTPGVTGSTESDGITLEGEVTEVDVSIDRTLTFGGIFGEPNFAGETFSVTGSRFFR